MCTILGQHISLIRPCRVAITQRGQAWKGAKAVGRKTRKLTTEMKLAIAREMGYKLAVADDNRQGAGERS